MGVTNSNKVMSNDPPDLDRVSTGLRQLHQRREAAEGDAYVDELDDAELREA